MAGTRYAILRSCDNLKGAWPLMCRQRSDGSGKFAYKRLEKWTLDLDPTAATTSGISQVALEAAFVPTSVSSDQQLPAVLTRRMSHPGTMHVEEASDRHRSKLRELDDPGSDSRRSSKLAEHDEMSVSDERRRSRKAEKAAEKSAGEKALDEGGNADERRRSRRAEKAAPVGDRDEPRQNKRPEKGGDGTPQGSQADDLVELPETTEKERAEKAERAERRRLRKQMSEAPGVPSATAGKVGKTDVDDVRNLDDSEDRRRLRAQMRKQRSQSVLITSSGAPPAGVTSEMSEALKNLGLEEKRKRKAEKERKRAAEAAAAPAGATTSL